MIVSVKDFGPIREAEIDVKPLTVFIGDNDTGKSLMAKLIYGLHKDDWYQDLDSSIYVNFENDKKKYLINPNKDYEILNSEINTQEFFNILNTDYLIHPQLSNIIKNILNSSVYIEQLDLYSHVESTKLTIKNENRVYKLLDTDKKEIHSIYSDYSIDSPKLLLNLLIKKKTLFIPAERVGVIDHIDKLKLGNDEINLMFSKAQNDFIRYFTSDVPKARPLPTTTRKLTKPIIDKINNEILGGLLEISKDRPPRIYKQSYIDKSVIELEKSASLIASITPLIMYLVYSFDERGVLIIEEPEAHLHPDAQKTLAEVFGMLINLGVTVLIITHSPYFVDHLNNLIEGQTIINKHPDKKDAISSLLPLDSLISPDKVSAYYFPKVKSSDGIVVENAFDELIDWKNFSDTSETIQGIASDLIDLKFENQETKE